MGLLTLGQPLDWEETKRYAEHVRLHGLQQFIHMYNRLKDRRDECLKWGDEVEYMLIRVDDDAKRVQVLLKAEELLSIMDNREAAEGTNRQVLWRPEFAAYMIEGTPGHPYGEQLHDNKLLCNFSQIEKNMRLRRKEIDELLGPNEYLISLTAFPRLGCPKFTSPEYDPQPDTSIAGSLFFPDQAIFSGHPRFKTLVRNIRSRRGRKVVIQIPIFKDTHTMDPFIEHFDPQLDVNQEARLAFKSDHIYMDAMGFGMGCCCLQVTFQAADLKEAFTLYDQLAPVCPIAMALSAASPIHRGYLSDRDCRWQVVSQSVDDRTKQESGEEPLSNGIRINKSRYDSIDSYISDSSAKYNDIPLIYNEKYYDQLLEAGVDQEIAKHVAHLFIRDPVMLYREKLHQDDTKETDHFENIQSSNWQTMRFKPPPPGTPIGWRVEFRPMEVQITDFENAAFVVFIVLLTRVILSYKLNLLIPISKVDENMTEAQKRDAVRRSKFWFRKDIITQVSPPEAEKCVHATGCRFTRCCQNETVTATAADESCILMSADQIINGSEEFPGLVPLLTQYLQTVEIDASIHCLIRSYLNLIAGRASGQFMTTAEWIRSFVRSHPDYKFDSVVSDSINYDLIKTLIQVTKGETVIPDLTGDLIARQ